MSLVSERLVAILERGQLDYADVARILDSSPRTVSRWAHDQTQPRWQARERLLEFFAVMERLQRVAKPAAAQAWLFTPNPGLSHGKPVDVLRDGGFRQVLGAIDALGEGVFA